MRRRGIRASEGRGSLLRARVALSFPCTVRLVSSSTVSWLLGGGLASASFCVVLALGLAQGLCVGAGGFTQQAKPVLSATLLLELWQRSWLLQVVYPGDLSQVARLP